MHRRENQGQPMRAVFGALREMVDQEPTIEVVYPVHLSPAVQEAANDLLGDHDRIHLIEPLDCAGFPQLSFEKLLYHVGFRWGARGGAIIRKTGIGIARHDRTPQKVFEQEP
mgnify:CR=1 FL=1